MKRDSSEKTNAVLVEELPNRRTREHCLSEVSEPQILRGETRKEGRYFRNVSKRRHIKKRVTRDDDPPTFGIALKPREIARSTFFFGEDGLSVNCTSCTCEHCSIELHPNPEQFDGTLSFDLQRLARFAKLNLVAEYDPVDDEETKNPCHFLILPEDDDPRHAGLRLRDAYEREFAAGVEKVPRDEPRRNELLAAKAKHEALFAFHLRP